MTINRVGVGVRASQAASLTGTFTMPSVPVDGNAIIGTYRESNNPTNLQLPAGFQWVSGSPFGPSGRITGFFYKTANGEANPPTYVIQSEIADTKSMVVQEVSGLNLALTQLLAVGTNTVAVTTVNTSSTGTLLKANCYAISALNLSGASGGTNAIDGGFSLLNTAAGLSDTFLAADQITNVNAALSANWSWLTSRTAQAAIAVFQEPDAIVPAPISGGGMAAALRIAQGRRVRKW